MRDGFGVSLAVDSDGWILVVIVVDFEGVELFGELVLEREFGGDFEKVVFHGGGQGVEKGDFGDVEEVDGKGVVFGLGNGCAAGEDDALEATDGVAGARLIVNEFLLDEFDGWSAEASGIYGCFDLDCRVLAAEIGERSDDGFRDLAVAHAERQDVGVGEEPVLVDRIVCFTPGVAAYGLFEVEQQGERGGVLGLAKVDTEDGLFVSVVDHG